MIGNHHHHLVAMGIDLECSPGSQQIGRSGGNPCVEREAGILKTPKSGVSQDCVKEGTYIFLAGLFFLTKPDFEVVRTLKLVDQSIR